VSKKLLIAAIFGMAVFAAAPAFADYIYDPPAENYLILSSQWRLKQDANGKYSTLSATVRGTNYDWPIDSFSMAHHIDSDSICTGDFQKTMDDYLKSMATVAPKPELFVQLCRKAKGSALQVAAIYPFNLEKSWTNAQDRGSYLLSLSAAKVRAMGSKANYKNFVEQHCNKETEKLLASMKVAK
jgi:hypothetical protein